MKKTFSALVLASLVGMSRLAQAEEPSHAPVAPPSAGQGLLIAGTAATVGGVANLIGAGLCKTSIVAHDKQDACFGTNIVAGPTAIATGITLLFVGWAQRGKYLEWKDHSSALASLTNVDVSVDKGRTMITWHVAF